MTTKYSLEIIFDYSNSELDNFIKQFTKTKYENIHDKRYMTIYYLNENNLLDEEIVTLLTNNNEKFIEALKISNTAQEFRNKFKMDIKTTDLTFNFYYEGEEINIPLSQDFINLIKEYGWIIIKKLGQGVQNAVFEIQNIEDNTLAALLVPINEECLFNNESKLEQYRLLQEKEIFDTNLMIKIYSYIECNVKITDDERFCNPGPTIVEIVEKIDRTLYDKVEEMKDSSISDKLLLMLDIKEWTNKVRLSLKEKGYVYTDYSYYNIGLIGDRMVLIDLISIQEINDNNKYKYQYNMFFAEEIAEKSSILFKNESEEDYDEMINLYNILIKCKYKSEKMYKDKDKKMMFPLINFKTTSILEYKFENPIHIYFVYELDMLVINDDRKDIIRLERSLVINLLFDLIKKGTYFYIQYADDVVKSTIMDDYGTLYRSYFLMGEKNIGKKLSFNEFYGETD